MDDSHASSLVAARRALKVRFTADCARELAERRDSINAARTAIGLRPYAEADLSAAGLEPAWFDAGGGPAGRALRESLATELELAHNLYGFPHRLASPEHCDEALWRSGEARKLSPEIKTELRARVEFGEEIRDHLKQVVDYEHKKRPELIPFSSDLLEELHVLSHYQRAIIKESRQGAPLLQRLIRPGNDHDALDHWFETKIHSMRSVFDHHLFTGEFQELDDILRKGLQTLAARDDFRPLLAPYLGAK